MTTGQQTAMLLHELLHGITGKSDDVIQGNLGLSTKVPSQNIGDKLKAGLLQMKFSYFCLLIVLLASLIPATRALQSGGPRVRVQVTDAYGNAVPAKQITLTGDGATDEVPQNEPFTTKYGRYTLEVRVPGFSNTTQSVVIDQPEQILAVGMRPGVMERPPPRCSIVGRVIPENGSVENTVNAVVRLLYCRCSRRAGWNFRVSQSGNGDYMLIAMGGKECLGTRTFRAVPTAGHADIRLAKVSGGCDSSKR